MVLQLFEGFDGELDLCRLDGICGGDGCHIEIHGITLAEAQIAGILQREADQRAAAVTDGCNGHAAVTQCAAELQGSFAAQRDLVDRGSCRCRDRNCRGHRLILELI